MAGAMISLTFETALETPINGEKKKNDKKKRRDVKERRYEGKKWKLNTVSY